LAVVVSWPSLWPWFQYFTPSAPARRKSKSTNEVAVFRPRAARKLGIETARAEIRRAEDIPPAIEALSGRADALYVRADALLKP
jgi:ABC-type uncharacterized transport system substrate-binding protein